MVARPVAIFPNSSALRALRIRFAQFVPATAFPALTTFHLATVADEVRLVDLLNFLAGAPLLQDLELTDVSPRKLAATDLSGWRQGRLLFKHLKRLVVADDIDTGRSEERLTALAEYQCGLLSILSIPPACVLAVGGVESTAHVADLLVQLWPKDSGQRCATQARLTPLGSYREWDQRGLQHFVVYLSCEGNLEASFSIVASNGTMARACLIDGLSTGHAFKTIRRLWIDHGPKWLYTDLPGILTALPCIEYLHF
ncbi:hypothetical protein TRAPUB_1315 [Trametes pubescens]|uniref:Uncharacterized protein n=1 Tax=Trametes pubescens TaxID=154538 RepID=A0A1M2VJQ1_TRAPU|nr:hypothetical protein TRAPUB_1315 [Trametes pubescens]